MSSFRWRFSKQRTAYSRGALGLCCLQRASSYSAVGRGLRSWDSKCPELGASDEKKLQDLIRSDRRISPKSTGNRYDNQGAYITLSDASCRCKNYRPTMGDAQIHPSETSLRLLRDESWLRAETVSDTGKRLVVGPCEIVRRRIDLPARQVRGIDL